MFEKTEALSLEELRDNLKNQRYITVINAIESLEYRSAELNILNAIAQFYMGQTAVLNETYDLLAPEASVFDLDSKVDWAYLLILMGRVSMALETLNSVIELSPAHVLALLRRAHSHMLLSDFDEAIIDVKAVINTDPADFSAWVTLAQILLTSHKSTAAIGNAIVKAEAAIVCAEELLLKPPIPLLDETYNYQLDQLHQLKMIYWLESDALESAENWIASLESVSQRVKCYNWLALSLAQSDRHADAEEILQRVVKQLRESAALTDEYIPLLTQFASLMELRGFMAKSVMLTRIAISIAPDKPSLWMLLARYSVKHRPELARKAIEKAFALIDDFENSADHSETSIFSLREEAKLISAELDIESENYEPAVDVIESILEHNPSNIHALNKLGSIEMQRGNIEKAIAHFEQVVHLDPLTGYRGLINARQYPKEESILLKMEREALRPSLSGAVSSGILFQVASGWQHLKQFDKAFSSVQLANESSKKLIGYDPVEHRQLTTRVLSTFLHHRSNLNKTSGLSTDVPVFVVGMPRSGTTLVEQILAGHSKIFGAGELGVIPQRIARLERWEKQIGSGLEFPECIDDLDEEILKGIAEDVLEELNELAAEDKPGALHIIDKLPHNFQCIGFIKLLFPNAKIISVRRDPCDIAISNYFTDFGAKHSGMGFAYDLEWIGQQLADHNLMMHHWHQVFPGEILEVQYEDVVEDTEGMARKMLDYIGVEWEPQVLAFNELDRPVKTASVWQVRQPIYKTSKAKWKRYEKHLGPLIKGTNAKITWEPFEMVRLPEPGMLQKGIKLYEQDDLDAAEYEFKKLLHHLPEHAAANHMVGIIYARKGHVKEAIELMEKALKVCPWNQNWRKDLIQALELVGNTERADELKRSMPQAAASASAPQAQDDFEWGNLTLPNTNPIY